MKRVLCEKKEEITKLFTDSFLMTCTNEKEGI